MCVCYNSLVQGFAGFAFSGGQAHGDPDAGGLFGTVKSSQGAARDSDEDGGDSTTRRDRKNAGVSWVLNGDVIVI